jgi:hypothetical protein
MNPTSRGPAPVVEIRSLQEGDKPTAMHYRSARDLSEGALLGAPLPLFLPVGNCIANLVFRGVLRQLKRISFCAFV